MGKLNGFGHLKVATLCSVVSLLLSSSFANAQRMGTKDGGGGGAYVCQDGGKLIKTMLVDLFEAENDKYIWADGNFKTLKIIRTQVDPEIQFENAMHRLALVDKELASQVRKEKAEIFNNVEYVADNVGLPAPQDLITEVFPLLHIKKDKNNKVDKEIECAPKGMMFYKFGKLKVKKSLMDALETKTDVAAAWAHEAIYKVIRDRYRTRNGSSEDARRMVGCLFSGKHDKNQLPDIYDDSCLRMKLHPPKDRVVLSCLDQENEIFVYPVDSRIKSVADILNNSTGVINTTDDIKKLTQLRVVMSKLNGVPLTLLHSSDIRHWTEFSINSAEGKKIMNDGAAQVIREYENQSELSTFNYNEIDVQMNFCSTSKGPQFTMLHIRSNGEIYLDLCARYYLGRKFTESPSDHAVSTRLQCNVIN